jgi:glycosyltransferase involved in cell wall biosynthesis
VTVIQNYRYNEPLERSNELRQWCGLKKNDRLVLAISTITSGFDAVLEGVAELPEHIHLATIGRFVPSTYEHHVGKRTDELHIGGRVHRLGEVPYAELTRIASGADVGLIVRDPDIGNNYVSLPNRVFDYMASGVPICAPNIPDIVEILETYKCGSVVENLSSEGWARAIKQTLEEQAKMSENALTAAGQLTWESREDLLYHSLGCPRSVVFLGIGKLFKNNRTQRMALSLAQRNVKVKICATSEIPDAEAQHPNISYKRIPLV